MNRVEDYNLLKNRIVKWIKNYADTNNLQALVVGVSGGIDSAVYLLFVQRLSYLLLL